MAAAVGGDTRLLAIFGVLTDLLGS
jgi:hypothetical protein